MVGCNSIECNSIECNFVERSNIYRNLNATPLNETLLNNQQDFSLKTVNEIKYYFVAEIKERELMSKRLNKYIAFCNYFDKSLIILSAASGSTSIASSAAVIGTPAGITSASLSLEFSLSTGIVKKL